MSPTTPHSSPNKAKSLPLPTSALPPKTPQQKRVSTTTVGSTPLSRGTSIKRNQDGDTDRVEKYNREDYEDYIREDLGSRVFVDYEVFMEYVLHVPVDWNTKWRPAIDAVIADADFKKFHEEYCGLCGRSGTVEKDLYLPLMKMANAVLDVLSKSEFDGIPSGELQYYHVNEPNRVSGGVMNKNGLSPDLVLLHKNRPRPEDGESIHWANPLHVLEVKPHGSAICDGENMPRLLVNGIDPALNHAAPDRANQSGPLATSRKRPADGSSTDNPRAAKRSKADSIGPQVPSRPPEPRQQVEPALQVCRYLLEMFSVPLLRSHATVSLVDRNRLQLYHANRSVILVSSAINFSQDKGKDKLIATIIAFHSLSLEQNGILASIVPENYRLLSETVFKGGDRVVQNGNELLFSGDKDGAFSVTLGDVVSRDPAVVGRSTLVINGKSARWPGRPLVVKISWPTSDRASETAFLKKASEMAKGDHAWAANHLPRLYYAEDVEFLPDSTLGSVARLFQIAKSVNGDYVYEPRILRIIIQERLYPLKSLDNVKDIGQVFLDVACVHRWLYDHPGILHRDLSFNNIMIRREGKKGKKGRRGKRGKKGEKIYGVLTDYDLSSWTESLKSDYTKTSQQRTGTPPYMAQELLQGTSPLHLYRHDVESLFYVMLLVSARHTIGKPRDLKTRQMIKWDSIKLPYQKWFNQQDYDTLGSLKYTFLAGALPIELSPDFEDFRPWLEDLQVCFSKGFKLQPTPEKKAKRWRPAGPTGTPKQFDDETLGGHITYDTVLSAIPHLEGKLKGLEIRGSKRSSAPGSSTSAGAT